MSTTTSARRVGGAAVPAARLAPNTKREPAAPLRFVQLLGLMFAVLGIIGFAGGLVPLGLAATGLALAVALLNAVLGTCLGCQFYPCSSA